MFTIIVALVALEVGQFSHHNSEIFLYYQMLYNLNVLRVILELFAIKLPPIILKIMPGLTLGSSLLILSFEEFSLILVKKGLSMLGPLDQIVNVTLERNTVTCNISFTIQRLSSACNFILEVTFRVHHLQNIKRKGIRWLLGIY